MINLPNQSDFIRTLQVLHAAQLEAASPEARDAADHELSHFLRLSALGRVQEFYASRGSRETEPSA